MGVIDDIIPLIVTNNYFIGDFIVGNLAKVSGKTIGDQKWVRVIGTPTPADEKYRQEANKSVFKQPDFVKACENAGLKPTKRQASKWNNKHGAAYNLANKIAMNGFVVPADV